MYIIAASKIWSPQINERLSNEIGEDFLLINYKNLLNIDFLKRLKAERIFFPHWSYIVPKEIFTQYEFVMFHMSDLPRGRGGSPLQNLILRGAKETKITAFRCTEKLDMGPVYLNRQSDECKLL